MFEHVDLNLPPIKRETIDGVRYYSVPDEDELIKLVSITSITSHYNKQIFLDWRKRVGNEEADRITKACHNSWNRYAYSYRVLSEERGTTQSPSYI